jgi:hypothetical protein
MQLSLDDSGELPHVSDADGRFEVANAQIGKVQLVIMPRDFSEHTRHPGMWGTYQIPEGEGVVDIGDVELVATRTERDQKPGDVGFELQKSELGAEPDDYLAKVALIRPGGPADGSGLEVGDAIETVDGHDVRGNNSSRLQPLIQVAPGQSFELGLAGGKTVKITAGPPSK